MDTVPELPHSIESERAVLGSILLNREAIIAVADSLLPKHFYLERHAQIYAAMLACYHAAIPPDTRTVAEELRRRGQFDLVGGIIELSNLVDGVPTSHHIEYYAGAVMQAAMRRQLIEAGGKIAALSYNEAGTDVTSLVAEAQLLIDSVGMAVHNPRYLPFTAAALDAEILPEPTWAVPGLLPVGLALLISKPKMRKSWLALAIAIAIATGGHVFNTILVEAGDVLYLALEDGKRRLQARQRKLLANVAAPRRLQYLTSAPRLDEGCIGLIDTWLKEHQEARLVIIDVLARVRPKQTSRGSLYDADYSVLQPLQELANRHNVAVLVVHHMNRSDASDVYDLINGTTGIGGSVDTLLGLQCERGQDEATLTISSREIEDDTSLALRWDNTTARWILLGKAADVQLSRERQAIINVLREEGRPMGPKEAAEALGRASTDYGNIKQLMYRMSRDGDLDTVDRGKYTLPALRLVEPPATTPQNQQGSQSDPGDLNGDHLPLGVMMT